MLASGEQNRKSRRQAQRQGAQTSIQAQIVGSTGNTFFEIVYDIAAVLIGDLGQTFSNVGFIDAARALAEHLPGVGAHHVHAVPAIAVFLGGPDLIAALRAIAARAGDRLARPFASVGRTRSGSERLLSGFVAVTANNRGKGHQDSGYLSHVSSKAFSICNHQTKLERARDRNLGEVLRHAAVPACPKSRAI